MWSVCYDIYNAIRKSVGLLALPLTYGLKFEEKISGYDPHDHEEISIENQMFSELCTPKETAYLNPSGSKSAVVHGSSHSRVKHSHSCPLPASLVPFNKPIPPRVRVHLLEHFVLCSFDLCINIRSRA